MADIAVPGRRLNARSYSSFSATLAPSAGVTVNPDSAWVTQQARNLAFGLCERVDPVRFLIRDRDAKFSGPFDEILRTEGVRFSPTPIRAPRANAYAERFVGTVRAECLDHLLILGRQHLQGILEG